MLPLFTLQARYNRWMNQKLFAVCAELSDEERKADRRAPFRSIHGTFNHLLLTDRMWLGRFTQNPITAPSLDHELYGDFAELRAQRELTDETIQNYIAGLSEADLNGDLRFVPMSNPQEYVVPLWVALTHFFNHQTHHRGQLTTILEQCGADFGVTDLLRMPDETWSR